MLCKAKGKKKTYCAFMVRRCGPNLEVLSPIPKQTIPNHPQHSSMSKLHALDEQKKGLAGNRTRDHSQHRLRVFKDAVRQPP